MFRCFYRDPPALSRGRIPMARQRTIKFPPKRGKLTIRQIEQAVDKVIQKRRAQEAITSTPKEVRNRGTNSE